MAAASVIRALPDSGRRHAVLTATATSAYLGGFAIPFPHDLPLVVLSTVGLIAAATAKRRAGPRAPIVSAAWVFLAATAISTAFSTDLGRSVRLSAPLLPAMLMFVLVTSVTDLRVIRVLYGTLSVVAFGLAVAVVWASLLGDWHSLHERVREIGSPLLVEANDIALVAIVAPLSLTLIGGRSAGAMRIVAACSLVAGLTAICILQSRVAFLTLAVSVGTFVWFTADGSGPQMLKTVAVVALATVLVDGSLGFPLAAKFQKLREPRLSLWAASAPMFVDAPIAGHGPHTFAVAAHRYSVRTELPAWLPPVRRTPPWAHNLLLECLVERGLIGLGSLILLLSAAVSRARHLRRHTDPQSRLLGAGVVAALSGFCFAGVLELSFVRLWVVVLLFTLLAALSQLSHHRHESRVSPC